jgi:hypothetical protein
MAREAGKKYLAPRSSLDVDLYRQPRRPRQDGDPPAPKDWCDWSRLTSGRLTVFEHPPALRSSDDILVEPHATQTASTVRTSSLTGSTG